ncbi:dipeptidase [Sphingopyxis macrogoltabida]|uniref:Membrane dipeptidase n=1 Tax=Sphingopyxis macrogoltabida TaxID=33050 RepID=A0AAC9AYZ3_SPHMC|nr:dipeptidase [Sphingopyxis macrogoltabida]ALJ16120.1 membrane dipeptidase [Sphingopyxis macrogoltabida]AMU92359.1 membrane dipeptidase [Sphingopyxis macrogoltabida]
MNKPTLLAGLAALALLSSPANAQQSPEAVAEAALKRAPVFDGHNDVPWALRLRVGNVINDFDFQDTTDTARPDATPPELAMHTDLARLRKGRVGAQFWSVYVPSNDDEAEAVQQTLEQIDVMKRLVARYPNDLVLVPDAAGLEKAMKAGKIGGMLGMEGGQSIGSSLAVLRQMYDLGARYMTLTHGKTTPWGDSATDAPKHDGLTDFGRQVVREMNRIGMIVDLSHVSEATMKDALETAKAPVMFSHSGVRAVNDHPRNVPDSVLPAVKANGGVIMVVFYPLFLDPAVRARDLARTAEKARIDAQYLGNPASAEAALKAWDDANPVPPTPIAKAADHIDHIRKTIGVDHIGLGSDYDGIEITPTGMEDVTGYPALLTELARRGYSQADLEKIASGNMLRVLKAVEAYAASQKGQPPVETPVAK